MTEHCNAPAWARSPPVLSSSQIEDVETDVGPMYVHRDDTVITPTLITTGHWEPREAAFLRSVLRLGSGFIDVGANVGYFSLLASAIVGHTGSVIAVEPEARNLDLLQANIWRNKASNVRVLPLAADAQTGYVGLRLSETNRGDHQVVGRSSEAALLVPSIRLDEVIPQLVIGSIDVIKVDVQGVDHQVVEGLARLATENPGIVLMCEYWLTGMQERGVEPEWCHIAIS